MCILMMPGPRLATSSEERTVESDTTISRRSVLCTVGVAVGTAIAGCAAEANRQSTSTRVIDETARVKPGQYEAFEFELDEARWTTVSANLSDRSVDVKKDGPSVDVVVMTAEQYSQFQKQRHFEYVGGVSMPGVVNGQVSATLKPGNYVALVDNTAAGSAKPSNSGVTGVVNLEITTSDSRN